MAVSNWTLLDSLTCHNQPSADYRIAISRLWNRHQQTMESPSADYGIAISRLWNRHQLTGNVTDLPRSGRPRSTTADDRLWHVTCLAVSRWILPSCSVPTVHHLSFFVKRCMTAVVNTDVSDVGLGIFSGLTTRAVNTVQIAIHAVGS